VITCTRCQGTGFLNIHQLPEEVRQLPAVDIWLWLSHPDRGAGHDCTVCDCCGDGADWYGEPGRHYSKADPQGFAGLPSNGGLCQCH
jgi:hypothetical protein